MKPIKRRGILPKQRKLPYFAIVLIFEAYNAIRYVDSGISDVDAVVSKSRLLGCSNTLKETKSHIKQFTKQRLITLLSKNALTTNIQEAIKWYTIIKCQDVSPYDTKIITIYDIDADINNSDIDKLMVLI